MTHHKNQINKNSANPGPLGYESTRQTANLEAAGEVRRKNVARRTKEGI